MKKNEKGFTLIELLVVIAIIGLLATLSVVALNTARVKARDARRVADIKQIQTAVEMFYDTNSSYPTSTAILTASGYMSAFPSNPTPRNDAPCPNSDYVYSGSATTYSIGYCLSSSSPNIGWATATPAGIR